MHLKYGFFQKYSLKTKNHAFRYMFLHMNPGPTYHDVVTALVNTRYFLKKLNLNFTNSRLKFS